VRFALGTLLVGLVVVGVIVWSDPYAILIVGPLIFIVLVLFVGALALERTANDDG
jgi:hypothetical protein